MPLNSHSYLVAQGWQGTGEALREGAITRPVVVTQKKNLAGVGKDRDEAFPFWDHVFDAAATSIKVKIYNDNGDEDSDTPQPSGSSTPLDRTSTGIISNKPPKVGLSVLTAPVSPEPTGLSVMALAKRESARHSLYSRFFRGPVLGPDGEEPQEPQALEVTQRSSPFRSESSDPKYSSSVAEKGKGRNHQSRKGDEKIEVVRKKRKPESETRQKEMKKPKIEADQKREVSELRPDGEVETEFVEVSQAPEKAPQGNRIVDHSRKQDRKKKRKWNEIGSTVRHDG